MQSASVVSRGKNGIVFRARHAAPATGFFTALKTSITDKHTNPDNLFYEAYVGRIVINPWSKRFPLFVRTFGLYRLRDPAMVARIARLAAADQELGADLLRSALSTQTRVEVTTTVRPESLAVSASCADPRALALHFEFVTSAVPLATYLQRGPMNWRTGTDNARLREFWTVDCPSLLLQIYAPLAALESQFTHYDMHHNNLLLSEVPGGKSVRLRYHLRDGRTVSMRTRFLVKLIDYGRCYTHRTSEIREALCRTRACGSDCGRSRGHVYINNTDAEAREKKHFITPMHVNRSHDLRAAYLLREKLMAKETALRARRVDALGPGCARVRRILRNIHYAYFFGTPDAAGASSVSASLDSRIATVSELFRALAEYCLDSSSSRELDNGGGSNDLIGSLDVYLSPGGQNMRFSRNTG